MLEMQRHKSGLVWALAATAATTASAIAPWQTSTALAACPSVANLHNAKTTAGLVQTSQPAVRRSGRRWRRRNGRGGFDRALTGTGLPVGRCLDPGSGVLGSERFLVPGDDLLEEGVVCVESADFGELLRVGQELFEELRGRPFGRPLGRHSLGL